MSNIQVSHLTFGYEGNYENVFEDVSFTIDTDWKLGLIGRNGKGKTTLLNLLLGKYTYQGTISKNVEVSYFPYEEWYKYNYPNHRDLIIHTTGLIKDKIYKLLSEHYYRKAINLFLKGKWFSYLYHKLSVFFV